MRRKKEIKIILNTLLIFILFSFIFLISCNNKSEPLNVVNDYFQFFYNGDFENSYKLLSIKDKKVISLKDYINRNAPLPKSYILIFKKCIWSVESIEIKDSVAYAYVSIKMPDFVEEFKNIFLDNLIDNNNIDAIKIIKDTDNKLSNIIINKNKYNYIIDKQKIYLILENREWKLFFNWSNKIEAEKITQKGINLLKNKKEYEAFDEFNKALKIDPDNKMSKLYLEFRMKDKSQSK